MLATVLGSCANQTAVRHSVSLIVENDDTSHSLMIDAGPSVVASLLKCGRAAAEIRNLVLTHTHADHISGFAYFVWHRHFERLGKPEPAGDLNVFGLSNSIDLAQTMLSAAYSEVKFPFAVHFHRVTPPQAISIGNMNTSFFTTKHTTPSIGIVVESGGKKIAVSGDTLPTPELIEHTRNADILFHEGMWTEDFRVLAERTMHSTAADAATVAAAASVKQLVLLHIYPPLIGKEGQLLLEAKSKCAAPVSVPGDGSVYIA